MGIIHRAHDRALNREIAIKVLQDRFSIHSTTARRFLEEARITGQLQHPGIPPVFQVGTRRDGRPFLAMKLIKGETLDELLKTNSPINRFAVFEAIANAVGYAHAHNVIHRDLKPANVMVGRFGEVQVMDWGLAKVLTASSHQQEHEPDPSATCELGTEIRSTRDDNDATQDGDILGTPAYMPPEQAIGSIDEIDKRSDVFGLGAILCSILTGKPPYLGGDAKSTRVLAAKGNLEETYARLDASGADPEIVDLCKRCLSPNKEHRPVDAITVATEVIALREAAEERAKQAEIRRAQSELRQKLERKHTRQILFMALPILMTSLIVVYFVMDRWFDKTEQRLQDERNVGIFEIYSGMNRKLGRYHDSNQTLDYALKLCQIWTNSGYEHIWRHGMRIREQKVQNHISVFDFQTAIDDLKVLEAEYQTYQNGRYHEGNELYSLKGISFIQEQLRLCERLQFLIKQPEIQESDFEDMPVIMEHIIRFMIDQRNEARARKSLTNYLIWIRKQSSRRSFSSLLGRPPGSINGKSIFGKPARTAHRSFDSLSARSIRR